MEDLDLEPMQSPVNAFWKGVAGAVLGFLVAMAFAGKGVGDGFGAIACMAVGAALTRYFISPD